MKCRGTMKSTKQVNFVIFKLLMFNPADKKKTDIEE